MNKSTTGCQPETHRENQDRVPHPPGGQGTGGLRVPTSSQGEIQVEMAEVSLYLKT